MTSYAHSMYILCMKTISLSSNDREFFSLVAKAAFTNPFSPKRLEIDRTITGDTTNRPWVGLRPEAIQEVTRRIKQLDADGPLTISDFKNADRQLIESVFLFDEYHKLNVLADKYIIQQIQADNEPLPVPFAPDAIARLATRGFATPAARRYFSLFYQIRRAFYFIERSLVGQSPCMKKLRENLWNNIFTYDIDQYQSYLWDRMEDFSTLLLGPTGSGKGAAAAAIGRSGFIPYNEKTNAFARSFTQTFVSANLSQFVETLLESELFGHARGAFTGAVESHDGLFAMCGKHGAIFLDEIGDISPQVQLKLLKVLEERIFSPVGSYKKLRFHGRVIAATNIDIDNLRQQGKFRDDFYYRLCSDCIMVPDLQQRIKENPNELNELIAHSVKIITGQNSPDLIDMAIDIIAKKLGPHYHWPGNVRELAQCIRSIIIKHDYTGQAPNESHQQDDTLTDAIEQENLDAQQLITNYCTALYKKHGTFEKVAQITKLDRRTVKKHIQTT